MSTCRVALGEKIQLRALLHIPYVAHAEKYVAEKANGIAPVYNARVLIQDKACE